MATRITVALEDDITGGAADETVRFGLGGVEYEIDLRAKNARVLQAGRAICRMCAQRRAWPTTPAGAHFVGSCA